MEIARAEMKKFYDGLGGLFDEIATETAVIVLWSLVSLMKAEGRNTEQGIVEIQVADA